jgi:hypothetical protein
LDTYYKDAPQLESFEKNFTDQYTFYKDNNNFKLLYDGENFIDNNKVIPKDEYITRLIMNLCNNGNDVKYYIFKIIEYYKNDKFPELQALWSTDLWKNNFNIKLKVTDTVSKWYVDKSGLIVTEKILNPMFDFTCKILKKSLLAFKEEMEEYKNNIDDMIPYLKKMIPLFGFIDKIENRTIQSEIMKGISSHFFLDIKKQKLLVEDKDKDKNNNYSI